MDSLKSILLYLDSPSIKRFASTSKRCNSIIMTILRNNAFYAERLPLVYISWMGQLHIYAVRSNIQISSNITALLCRTVDILSLYKGKYEKLIHAEYAICLSALIDLSKHNDGKDLYDIACLLENKYRYHENMLEECLAHTTDSTFAKFFDYKDVIRDALKESSNKNNVCIFSVLLKHVDLSENYDKNLIHLSLDRNSEIMKLILTRPEVRPTDGDRAYAFSRSLSYHKFAIAELLSHDDRFVISGETLFTEQMMYYISFDLMKSFVGNERISLTTNYDFPVLIFIVSKLMFSEAEKLELVKTIMARKTKPSHYDINKAIYHAQANKLFNIYNYLQQYLLDHPG